MENDSIRASGQNTVVELWIDGKLRSICVTPEAIAAFVGFDQAAELSEEDRCEFVRSNLALVISGARTRLSLTNREAETVVIDAGHLPRGVGQAGERRTTDRRKAERRKADVPIKHPDRRRSDRRGGQRRTRGPKTEK